MESGRDIFPVTQSWWCQRARSERTSDLIVTTPSEKPSQFFDVTET
jgi:hypothetical protein